VNDGDSGILGNLPRSRPGTRSEKRTLEDRGEKRTLEERQEAAARPEATPDVPRPPAGAGAQAAARRSAPASRARAEPKAERRGARADSGAAGEGDLVGGAVRIAGRVAETGVAVTAEVAKAVLRRLPRP
jgi:hypothetical protein